MSTSYAAPDTPFAAGDLKAGFALPLAFLLVATPIFVHAGNPYLGLMLSALVGVLVANFALGFSPVLLVVAFLFQNMFVAMVSPTITSPEDFNLVRGHNFILLVSVWSVVLLGVLVSHRRVFASERVLMLSTALLPLIAVYMVVGQAKGLEGAPTYLRNIVGPLMCLQIGLIAARLSASRPERIFIALGWVTVMYGYLELVFDLDFLALFNGDVYLNRKLQDLMLTGYWHEELRRGFVVRDQLDMMRTSLLNTPFFADLKISLFRLHGPNFHPISYGYALALLSLVGLASRHVLLFIAAAPLLVLVGSKGALVLVVVAGGAMLIAPYWRSPSLLIAVALALAAIVVVAFFVGLSHGDYHVLGLLGSINGFLEFPAGYGLGAGGNLTNTISRTTWESAQAVGRTSVALESGVGVLLYQMGVAAIPVLGFYVWLTWHCWRSYITTGAPLLALAAFSLAALLANSVLQEEALFAPLAFGLALLIAGLALGHEPPRRLQS